LKSSNSKTDNFFFVFEKNEIKVLNLLGRASENVHPSPVLSQTNNAKQRRTSIAKQTMLFIALVAIHATYSMSDKPSEPYKTDSRVISTLSPPQDRMWIPPSVDIFVSQTAKG
jgi:hypothetical protein